MWRKVLLVTAAAWYFWAWANMNTNNYGLINRVGPFSEEADCEKARKQVVRGYHGTTECFRGPVG